MDPELIITILAFAFSIIIVAVTFYRLRSRPLAYRALMTLGFLGLLRIVIPPMWPRDGALLVLAIVLAFGIAGLIDWLDEKKTRSGR